jgi:hypothetical protein
MVSLDEFPQYIDSALQEIEPLIASIGSFPYVKDVVTMERRLLRSRNNLQSIFPLIPRIVDSANEAAVEEGLPPIKPFSSHNQSILNKHSANVLRGEQAAKQKVRLAAEAAERQARLAAEAAEEQRRPEKKALRALRAANAVALEEGRPPLAPIAEYNQEGIRKYGARRAAEDRAAAVETARAVAAAEDAVRPERPSARADFERRARGQNLRPPQIYLPGAQVLGEHVISPEALRVLNMNQQLARMTRNLGGKKVLEEGLARRGGRRATKRVRRNKTRGRR